MFITVKDTYGGDVMLPVLDILRVRDSHNNAGYMYTTIATIIKRRASTIDCSNLLPELRSFIGSL